jgi:type I restriction enzyme S subunit
MNSKTFFDNFETIANAPGGIARLRELILALAITGSLSNESEKWTRETFDSIGKWIGGNGFPTEEQGKSGGEILFCKVSDMNLEGNEKFIHQTVNTLTKEDANRLKVTIHECGSVIFPKIGGAIATNKRRILVRPTAIDNNCMGVQPSNRVNNEWLYLLLKSIDLTKYQSGTSLPSLSQKVLNKITFKVPPLEEQKRIVAKVDELMALCDELEAAQNQRDSVRTAARKSAIDAISSTSSPEELDVVWKRISGNWLTIADTPESISSLRSLILDLAVRGELVSSDRKAWKSSTLGEAVEIIRGVTFPASAKQRAPGRGLIPCLRTTNVQSEVDWDDLLYIPEEYVRKDSQFVQLDDVLISMANSRELVGKVALVRRDDVRCTLGGFIAAIRCGNTILPRFLIALLRVPSAREKLIDSSTQTTNIANISLGRLNPFELSLPPITEQRRIVSKIDELMTLCDELEHSLLGRNDLIKKISGALANEAAV